MPTVDLHTFATLLGDLAPNVERIDGLLFLDRFDDGPEELKTKIAGYANAREAQRWINLVPIDDLIDCAVPDWSLNDPELELIADIFRRSWTATIRAKYGELQGISVQVLKDADAGDLVLKLVQE